MSTTETKVKEMPIPFKSPMVQAILEGRKTQTRRIVKPKHDFFVDDSHDGTNRVYYPCSVTGEPQPEEIPCPYGGVGERLWVKETARVESETTGLDPWHAIEYAAGGSKVQRGRLPGKWFPSVSRNKDQSQRWHPSIFMPRWASRITLEITGVRVERLNQISLADCIAEGIEPIHVHFVGDKEVTAYRDYSGLGVSTTNAPFRSYETLWESINGPGSWALNPWVWVIEFTRIGDL